MGEEIVQSESLFYKDGLELHPDNNLDQASNLKVLNFLVLGKVNPKHNQGYSMDYY